MNFKTAILTVSILCLGACAPSSDGDSENKTLETKTLVVGYSRPVQIEFFGAELNPVAPDEIKVNFERVVPSMEMLQIRPFPQVLRSYVESDLVVEFGCSENSPKVLPTEITADQITFCGDLEYQSSGLRYTANMITFKAARIKIVGTNDHPKFIDISMRAKEIHVFEESSITLEGKNDENRRGLAPKLILGAMLFFTYDKLDITSKASFEIVSRGSQ